MARRPSSTPTRGSYWEQTILGEPASKSNRRRLVRIGGVSRFIKSAKALAYEGEFLRQAKAAPLRGPVKLTVEVWYRTWRPDLDVSLIKDLLQGVAYLNDRQVVWEDVRRGVDPANPRAHIVVQRVEHPQWYDATAARA